MKKQKLNKSKLVRFVVVSVILAVALIMGFNKIQTTLAVEKSTQTAITTQIATQVATLEKSPGFIDVNVDNAYVVYEKKEGSRNLLFFVLDETLSNLQGGSEQHFDAGMEFASKLWLSAHSDYSVVKNLSVSPTIVVYQIQ